MRIVSTLAFVVVAAVGLASAAQAAPHAAPARIPVLADHVGITPDPPSSSVAHPYAFRWVGGYYQTEYRWIWVEGPFSHYDAFGRAHYGTGHWEQRCCRVWVPYSVQYARPYARYLT